MLNTIGKGSKASRPMRAVIPPLRPPRLYSMEASGWPAMMRVFLAPRSRLLTAAALVALLFAVFLTADTTPAQAQQLATQSRFYVWTSTLTIGAGNTWRGYDGNVGFLPNPSFTFDGVTYEIERLSVTNSDKTLQLVLDKAIPDRLISSLRLQVGYSEFSLASATLASLGGVTNDTATWAYGHRNWPTAGYNRPVALTATDLWSATLTAKDLGSGMILGCDQTVTGAECSSGLTDNSFTYAGEDYQISALSVNPSSGLLVLTLDKTIPDSLNKLVLHVGDRRFGSASGAKSAVVSTDDTKEWSNTALSWSADDTVRLRLTERQRLLSYVGFAVISSVSPEINIHTSQRSIEEIPVRIDPPLDSGDSHVILRIKDHCATSDYDRIATQVEDYIVQLPNAPSGPDTKLLRLPEGKSEVIIRIRMAADRKNELDEHTCLELVPINDAPYVIVDKHSESIYPETELQILDNSMEAPDEADPRRGINVRPDSAELTEGASVTYIVELRSIPLADVRVFARVLNPNTPPIRVRPTSVTFTKTNWFERKTFTVTAPPGHYRSSASPYTIMHTLSSDGHDPNYDSSYWFHGPGIDGQTHIRVAVNDAQESGGGTEGDLGVVRLPTGLTLALDPARVSESGGQATITATLDAPAPLAGVSLGLYPSTDSTAARDIDYTLPATIAIPEGEQSGSARIEVTDDALDEDDETAIIAAYAEVFGVIVADRATLTITDDDTAGLTVSAASPLAVDEGGSASYTVVLDSRPTADVTVSASSGDNGAATVSPASHTFTPSGWNTPLTFTVSGVSDDDANDENVAVSQSISSGDTQYAAVSTATVSVSVSDTTPEQQGSPNQAPTVSSAIADATIVNQSGTKQVSLSGVFIDADNDTLTVTAASSDEDVATVSVAPDYSSLTVSAHSRGIASITVTADDGNGGTVADTFTVSVKAAPVVASALADVSGLEVGSTQDVSLSGVFSDADGDALTITAASSDDAKATVTVASDQSKLTVAGVAEGTATITVTAQDADGNTVSDTFDAPVAKRYASLIAQMYEWRNDPRYVGDKAHTDRWDRTLLTFGETVADTSLTQMTVDEAQGYADRGWERWVPVAAALREMESGE